MGDTIWVDVQDREKAELPADNTMLLKMQSHLQKLAAALKVDPLTDFYGRDGWLRSAKWLAPATALASVSAIQDRLQSHPEELGFELISSRKHWPQNLMNELQGCR